MSSELKLTFGWTGSSHDDDLVIDVDAAPPPPPVAVSIELYLINESGTPAWIDVSGKFTRTDFLGTDSNPLPIEGALSSGAVTVARTCSQQLFPTYDGGRLTFTLRNLYGEWDPLNPASPWQVGGVTLLKQGSQGTPVRVSVTPPGGTSTVIFTGRVTSWPPAYIGSLYSSVTVVAQDGVAQLKATNFAALQLAVGAGTSAGTRVNRSLDNAVWDSTNDSVDETLWNSLQATVFKSDACSEAQKATQSDMGWLWMSAANGVHYRTRVYPIGATPVVTFANSGASGTLLYDIDALSNANDTTQTSNSTKVTREGGTEQAALADDATTNGIASTSSTGLVMETDRQAMDTAIFTTGFYRNIPFRPTQIGLTLTDFDTRWTSLVGLDMFDTVETEQKPPKPPHVADRTLTSQVLVSGLTWRFQTGKKSLTIDTVVAPPVVAPAKVGTAKVGSSVAQFTLVP